MRSSRSDDSPTASGLTRGKSWAAATPGATPITTTIINATKRCFMIPPARRPGRHDSRSSRGRFDPPPCRPARRHRMSEIRDGMRIEWHVPITMDDGIVLRADVYRPIPDGRYPVILSHGVYAKGLSYQEGYPMQWQKMVLDHPEILEGSTNKYQAWEVTDPERWVPHGYAIVRVDSRGSGWSPGYLDPLCPREDDDLAACIEWAGTQPWSNGKVGMLGISYYAVNQWRVAAKHQPRHLGAIIPWEGFNDFYRDPAYHGGILSGFMQASSPQKWLEVHGESHWALFSSGYGLALQKKFFDHFLKGLDNGWDKTPPVTLNVRHPGEKFVLRHEHEWPLARTQWTTFYLDPATRALTGAPGARGTVEYDALGQGVTFSMMMDRETEITGPLAAKLFVSSSTADADLFLILRVFDPNGRELTFFGSTDPHTPIANGWLRASHRRLDPKKSTPWQPYHPHDRVEPLTPGHVYECDVEVLPTCIVVPAGWRVAATVRGKDYEYEGDLDAFGTSLHYSTRGTGGMTHNDPISRPRDVFGGAVTLHTGGDRASYVLLPIIRAR